MGRNGYTAVMTATIALLVFGFAYSLVVSFLAYRESGDRWMLLLPTWIDAKCGVSARVRWHGKLAFGILFVATGLWLFRPDTPG